MSRYRRHPCACSLCAARRLPDVRTRDLRDRATSVPTYAFPDAAEGRLGNADALSASVSSATVIKRQAGSKQFPAMSGVGGGRLAREDHSEPRSSSAPDMHTYNEAETTYTHNGGRP